MFEEYFSRLERMEASPVNYTQAHVVGLWRKGQAEMTAEIKKRGHAASDEIGLLKLAASFAHRCRTLYYSGKLANSRRVVDE